MKRVVAPVVSEVVDIEKLVDAPVDDRLQPDACRLVEPFIRIAVVLGLAIAPFPDLEFDEVRVRPAERELDEVVEGEQGRRERHVDPAPDCGFDLLKLDPEPGDGLDHGALRWGGLKWSGARGKTAWRAHVQAHSVRRRRLHGPRRDGPVCHLTELHQAPARVVHIQLVHAPRRLDDPGHLDALGEIRA